MTDRRPSRLSNLLLVVVAACIGFYFWERTQQREVAAAKVIKVPAPNSQPVTAPDEPFPEREMAMLLKIKSMHSTGDFEGALKFSNEQLLLVDLDPKFRSWLGRQIPALLTSVGWLKIKLGECSEAIKFFYRANRIAPLAETRKGLGVCAHQSKNWPDAASWFAGYILEKPQDIDVRALYADTLESLGRYDEAVATLEGATQIPGIDPKILEELQRRLKGMRAKAREGVRQRSEYSRHFYVSYREDDHDRLVATVFDVLESALDEFAEVTGIPAPLVPIEVVLYRREAFSEVIPGGPAWSEGIFDGRIRVPLTPEIANDPRGILATVLRHELSHALLASRSSGRPWPTWFDEGLAQYLACRHRTCDVFHFGATPGQFSDPRLLSEPFLTLGDIEAGRAYTHSLYLVRMIVHGQSDDVITKIIHDLPDQGAISSDVVTNLALSKSFNDLIQFASVQWKKMTVY